MISVSSRDACLRVVEVVQGFDHRDQQFATSLAIVTDDAGLAKLLAENDLLRRQLDANSDAHRDALADLRASEERLEMALSAGDGIGTWDWDVVHDRVVADTRFARLHGIETAKAAAGMPFADFLGGMLPDDRPDRKSVV